MTYYVEVDSGNKIAELLRDDYTAIPAGAIAISDADGDMLAKGQFAKYQLVNGVVSINQNLELQDAREQQKAIINNARDAAAYADVQAAIGGTVYAWQADARSVSLLNGAITLAQNGGALPPEWRTSDNINVPISALADLLAIAAAISASVNAAYAKSWTLKAQIDAATTVADVQAVVW